MTTQLTTVRPQPTALPRTPTTTPTRSRFQHTPGSRQVVSVRGRRVTTTHKADPKVVKFLVLVTAVLAGGIATTIGLSGVSTEQTFKLQELHAEETQLNNQLETLHRDVIESALVEHHAVAEAAVIGVPDEATGEAVAAFVILKTQQQLVTPEEAPRLLTNFVAEQIGAIARPKQLLIVPELPKTRPGSPRLLAHPLAVRR